MTNAQVFGLGVVIVLGMALQAALMRAPAVVTIPSAAAATSAVAESVEVEKIRAQSAKVEALIARGPATTLVVGDHTIVVRTDWHAEDGDTRITHTYYEYKDGKLVQVPLVQTVAAQR